MNQRIYHGEIVPAQIADGLVAHFHRGNYRTQQLGSGNQVVVQIVTNDFRASGGQTALSITLRKVEDGVSVQIGKQAWLGIAASLGATALRAIHNPLSLLNRLDDLAQDIESIQLTEEVLEVIEQTARAIDAGFQLSEKFRRMVCEYCETANPVGAPSCVACGAPLGKIQPITCKFCGFIISHTDTICPNCRNKLY
jgi:hypothetical protein